MKADDHDLMHFSLMALIFIFAMLYGLWSYFHDQSLRAECEATDGHVAEVHSSNIFERGWVCE